MDLDSLDIQYMHRQISRQITSAKELSSVSCLRYFQEVNKKGEGKKEEPSIKTEQKGLKIASFWAIILTKKDISKEEMIEAQYTPDFFFFFKLNSFITLYLNY